MNSYKKRKAIRQGLCVALSVLCILTLAACGKTGEAQQGAVSKATPHKYKIHFSRQQFC